MNVRFSQKLSQSAAVAALALCAGFAAAQATPGVAGAGTHGGHRMHGPEGMHGGHFGKRLEAIKSQLNLNATQDAQFAVAKRATEAAMSAGKSARMNAQTSAKAELAKSDPDLAMLLTAREAARDAAQTQRKAATTEWAKFLSLLNPEQKTVIKSQLLDRMQRAEAMREKMGHRAKG